MVMRAVLSGDRQAIALTPSHKDITAAQAPLLTLWAKCYNLASTKPCSTRSKGVSAVPKGAPMQDPTVPRIHQHWNLSGGTPINT